MEQNCFQLGVDVPNVYLTRQELFGSRAAVYQKQWRFVNMLKKKKKIKEKQKTKLKGLNIVFVHNAKQWSTMSKIVKITEKKVNVK